MLKSIAICALLFGLTLSVEQTLEFANISVMKLLHSRNLFMLKINTHLYSLTWKNATHLEVFSTNQTEAIEIAQNGIEKCSFDTRENPFKQTNLSEILNAVVLDDNHTVAAIGLHQYSFDGNKTVEMDNYYDLFLFDLTSCDYKMIKTIHMNFSKSLVPVSHQKYQPQLIAHSDSFDIFFAGEEECVPCRYNSEGEPIELEHKLVIDFDGSLSSFHVRLLDPIDTERNYFFVQNFRNGTAVMKLLNQDFEMVKQRVVYYKIDFVAVNKDVGAPIGICYFSNYDLHMYCERLDFYLNPVLKPFRVTLPFDNDILDTTVTLDTLGNTFVGLLHAPLQSKQRQIAVFRYDLHGQLAEALDLGIVDTVVVGDEHFSADRIVQLGSYIVEGLQNQYCVVAHEIRDINGDHHNTLLKCFQAPKDDQ